MAILTPEYILDLWNSLMPLAIQARPARLTLKRRIQLEARLREHSDITLWQEGIAKIARSRFCRGDNTGWHGNGVPWVAHFGWLCERRDAIVRAAEGLYDDRPLVPTSTERAEYQVYRQRVGTAALSLDAWLKTRRGIYED